MRIQDSVVFITGANRGVGLAFAREALARGAKKVYAGMRQPADPGTPGVEAIPIDVTNPASVAAAAGRCDDTTVLINNAGIAALVADTLDPALTETSRRIFETNYHGVVTTTQAFVPVLARNGGGAILNVLSDAVWLSRPVLAAYSPSKAAAWSFTNALRLDLRARGTLVVGLHVGFVDTDMTAGLDLEKTTAAAVATAGFDGLESGAEEVLVDEGTRALKRSLSGAEPLYLRPPALA